MKLKEVKHIEDNKIGIKEGFLKAMRIKTAHELLFEKGFNLVREDITTVVYREKSGKEKKELKLNKTEKTFSFTNTSYEYLSEHNIVDLINYVFKELKENNFVKRIHRNG